mmetsp:Transcript_5477/g.6027  ORF Transcript_5477/g.6027 Transcript_5477/m.6027 type:complete len:594 (-) Transcript_5477:157-1938(-)
MATTNKYDRQLRLWGQNGQKSLSESCIILIGCSAAGTESLKNLVLPGIGSFHVIDDQIVESRTNNASGSSNHNRFSNFFVFPDHDSMTDNGENPPLTSRAEIASKHLSELNPDVKGSFTDVPSLANADYASIFKSVTSSSSADHHLLVIAADLPPCILKSISTVCWNYQKPIPLVIVRSYGLLGTVRIQTPLHTVIESKPDNSNPDLRLFTFQSSSPSSFDTLINFVNSIQLKTLESHEHGHIPYLIILCKAIEKWYNGDDNNTKRTELPKTFEEKKDFTNLIKSMSRNYNHELNFQEAVEKAFLAYSKKEIPYEILELLNNVCEDSIMSSFDLLLLTLKRFMKVNHDFPPLVGTIPDMTSSTNYYMQLQEIYKTKAKNDEMQMKEIMNGIQNELSTKSNQSNATAVSDEELSIFCKNVYNLHLTKTRSYTSEYDFFYASNEQKEEIQGDLMADTYDPYEVPVQTPMLWFIALRAADAFCDEYGHYPGKDSRKLALESDAKIVQGYIEMIVEKMGLLDNELIKSTLLSTDDDLKNAFASEITRYYNAEVHNIASVVGGIASQEAVKLITRQYEPMNGTYVYNGIAGVAGVYQF